MVFRSTRPLLALTLLVVSAALASADPEIEKRFKVLDITFPRAAKAVLTYNKPNFESTGVSPVDAAKTWPQFEIIAETLNAPLGAPAAAPCANNCTAIDPFAWWDDFFASCENCKVDFIPTSLLSCNVGWMTAYLEEIHARYNRSVWVTEFACPSRSSEEQYAFMKSILDWLERTPWIERYAALGVTSASLPWMSAAGQLFDSTRRTLTELGKLYDAFEPRVKPDVISCKGLGGLKTQRERAEELGI
ncbi:glycosyl hydrolase, partial [Helicosporidium sp. ATCC 50920]